MNNIINSKNIVNIKVFHIVIAQMIPKILKGLQKVCVNKQFINRIKTRLFFIKKYILDNFNVNVCEIVKTSKRSDI
jgi:hypothetical protein